MQHRIGIDAGSKTIKVVILDEQGNSVYTSYKRHRFDIKTMLTQSIHDVVWRLGNIQGTVAITGSAGIGIAQAIGVPFVQEVVATTRAVQDYYPDADAVIELGGEDAKVIYLTGGIEQRMNATCAGGTGGFIDTIAFMIGSHSANMSSLGFSANRIYPIASRCAVFAQTDIRPLLNAGARREDLAGSAHDAVVRQTLGGLACGRPLKGTVVFLGGPLEYNDDLVRRFRTALHLNNRTGIKPQAAHLFTALGCAELSNEQAEPAFMGLADLEQKLKDMPELEADLTTLEPLFTSESQIETFRARHEKHTYPRNDFYTYAGPMYMGLDAGSTAVKLAVLDDQGRLLYQDYQPTGGDALSTTADMLSQFYLRQPRDIQGRTPSWVAHATATGYGEDILRAGLGFDSGVVETTAHTRAALSYDPQLSFLLDIGGQDMKAIWVRNGIVEDAVLNEACSSGCGSFIEGTAYSLKSTPIKFAQEALMAEHPVDLGTKCTVFMTSRVRHAQKVGAKREDLAAGIAYSVVKNALFRIIGMDNISSMGSHIVVQGGSFQSDAVLRAFEKVSGVEVVRPDTSRIMGAIGAAIVARERAQQQAATQGAAQAAERSTSVQAAGTLGASVQAAIRDASLRDMSGVATRAQLAKFNPKRKALVCSGCNNSCSVSVMTFGNGRSFVTGNRCSRALDVLNESGAFAQSKQDNADATNNAAATANAAAAGATTPAAGATTPAAGATTPAAAGTFKVNKLSDAYGKDTSVSKAPNALAVERRLIESLEGFEGIGERANVRLGIIDTLAMYRQMPFWHQLFQSLGFSLVISRSERSSNDGLKALSTARTGGEGLETIPSESVCYPAKLTHSRLYALAGAGATAVFMPHCQRISRCPVACEYPTVLPITVPIIREGDITLCTPELSARKVHRIADDPQQVGRILACLNALLPDSARISADEMRAAMSDALTAHARFEQTVARANERAMSWAHEPGHHGVVLDGRPYHTDSTVMHGIDQVLCDLNLAVISGGYVGELARSRKVSPTGIGELNPDLNWRPAKHLKRVANFVAQDDNLSLVCLQSFNCVYDALSVPEAQSILRAAGKPFVALKIDDIMDTAHVRIRLRTLAEGIEHAQHSRTSENARTQQALASLDLDLDSEPSAPNAPAAGCSSAAGGPRAAGSAPAASSPGARDRQVAVSDSFALARKRAQAVAQLAPLDAKLVDLARAGSVDAFANLDDDDVTAGRMHARDVCFAISVMAGRAIRLVAATAQPTLKHKPLATLVVPYACEGCVLDGLGRIIERALGYCPPITWVRNYPTVANGMEEAVALENPKVKAPVFCPKKPRIGILGEPALVFDPFMNDHLVDFIQGQGFEVVMPRVDLLEVDDVRHIDQMDEFAAAGCSAVIHLISFACLKGHVQARGAANELRDRYPWMPVTIIDYDQEASALNRENRIRLALAAAAEANAQR